MAVQNPTVQIKFIPPGKMNPNVFPKFVLEAMKNEINRYEDTMDSLTSSWQERPKWTKGPVSESRGGFGWGMWTSDSPFIHLNNGTKKRWATMRPGYRPKTSKGSLTTSAGPPSDNQVVTRGRRFMRRPRKGIAPRRFTETLAKMERARFTNQMKFAFKSAAGELFDGAGAGVSVIRLRNKDF